MPKREGDVSQKILEKIDPSRTAYQKRFPVTPPIRLWVSSW